MKTQGEIEAAICEGVSRFEQEYMGRGPKHIHAHLIGDLLKGSPDTHGRQNPDTHLGNGQAESRYPPRWPDCGDVRGRARQIPTAVGELDPENSIQKTRVLRDPAVRAAGVHNDAVEINDRPRGLERSAAASRKGGVRKGGVRKGGGAIRTSVGQRYSTPYFS